MDGKKLALAPKQRIAPWFGRAIHADGLIERYTSANRGFHLRLYNTTTELSPSFCETRLKITGKGKVVINSDLL